MLLVALTPLGHKDLLSRLLSTIISLKKYFGFGNSQGATRFPEAPAPKSSNRSHRSHWSFEQIAWRHPHLSSLLGGTSDLGSYDDGRDLTAEFLCGRDGVTADRKHVGAVMLDEDQRRLQPREEWRRGELERKAPGCLCCYSFKLIGFASS